MPGRTDLILKSSLAHASIPTSASGSSDKARAGARPPAGAPLKDRGPLQTALLFVEPCPAYMGARRGGSRRISPSCRSYCASLVTHLTVVGVHQTGELCEPLAET